MWFTIISNLLIALIFISPLFKSGMFALYGIVGFTTLILIFPSIIFTLANGLFEKIPNSNFWSRIKKEATLIILALCSLGIYYTAALYLLQNKSHWV